MTLGMMQLVWDSTVPAPERFTLLALADRADEEGHCYPSVLYLCRKCATSERTIQRHLGALETMGVLRREVETGKTTRYYMQLDVLRGMQLPPVTQTVQSHPRQSDTPVNLTPPSDCPPTPVNLSSDPRQSDTQSVKNPKEHPSEGARTRGTRIPDGFAVTADMRTWARANTPLVGKTETEQFVDYWTAETGSRATKRDWVRAWQVWMRKAQADAERRTAARPLHAIPKPTPEYGTFEQILESADTDFVRRLIRVNYLMPDQPYGDRRPPAEWRRLCAREWITKHEGPIRAALDGRKRA